MIKNNQWLRSVKIEARTGGVRHIPVQSKAKVKVHGSWKNVTSTHGYFQTNFEHQQISYQGIKNMAECLKTNSNCFASKIFNAFHEKNCICLNCTHGFIDY